MTERNYTLLMREKPEELELGSLTKALEAELAAQYGPMVSGNSLWKILGYPSMGAFRQAVFRNAVGIPLFTLPKRRGKFALVKDIAEWLAEQRQAALLQSTVKKKEKGG